MLVGCYCLFIFPRRASVGCITFGKGPQDWSEKKKYIVPSTLTAPLLKLFNLRQKTSTKQRYYHNTTVNTPRNINSSTGQQKLWTQQRKTKTFNVKKQYTIQRFNNRINNRVVTIERKNPPRYKQQLWFQQVYLYLNTTVSTLEWLYFIKKKPKKQRYQQQPWYHQ